VEDLVFRLRRKNIILLSAYRQFCNSAKKLDYFYPPEADKVSLDPLAADRRKLV
jgi:hypothetical protein